MKTKLYLFISVFFILFSCKKDDSAPQEEEKMFVFTSLAETHNNNLLHIDAARKTIYPYSWEGDTLVLDGPASYEVVYKKATDRFVFGFQNEIMPDSTSFCKECLQGQIIQKFLELRRSNSASESFNKLKLGIPTAMYEVYPRFWERFLSLESFYLINQIGGSATETNGTRSLYWEKLIRDLPYSPDENNEDPWACNCNAVGYIADYYKNYSEGPKKRSSILEIQIEFEFNRFMMTSHKIPTKREGGYYYIEIPTY